MQMAVMKAVCYSQQWIKKFDMIAKQNSNEFGAKADAMLGSSRELAPDWYALYCWIELRGGRCCRTRAAGTAHLWRQRAMAAAPEPAASAAVTPAAAT